ncbi:MAG: SDR family NAD(P)-dependent oxidoreductase [Bacteroidales bacterium]|nr:SDR family NAD(P)-dependent oxidoreductase [Bacteroidales bacterium]MDD4361512.1 SDR family NAD(P)-dependent oxidoreductase [Bacteroidales bacterium]MDD4429906.1 SDR family NAD(P)-dependent oxidoreductase [Bacteroidales bacterium]
MSVSSEVIIVTGASAGIGKAIIQGLAGCGIRLIMACRNPEKSAAVKAALEKSYPGTDIEVLSLDLASFASIRQFASIMALKKYSINTLINNAGVLPAKFSLTEDGFETALGVNYLGLFLLNELLLPLMRPGSLIINTISCSYRIGRLHQEMFRSKPEARFMRIFNYARSKRAILVYSLELAERLAGRGIRVLAVDPGIVSTKMIEMKRWFDPLTDVLFRPLIKKPAQGADTAVFLSLEAQMPASEYAKLSGLCFKNRKAIRLSAKIRNKKNQKELWDWTTKAIQGH